MRLLHKQIICSGPKLNFNYRTANTLPRTVDRRMLFVSKACYCNSRTNFSTHYNKKTPLYRCFLHATVFLSLRSSAVVEEIRHSISHCCSHNFMCESRKTQGHRYSKAHGFSNFCWISAKMLSDPIQRSLLAEEYSGWLWIRASSAHSIIHNCSWKVLLL